MRFSGVVALAGAGQAGRTMGDDHEGVEVKRSACSGPRGLFAVVRGIVSLSFGLAVLSENCGGHGLHRRPAQDRILRPLPKRRMVRDRLGVEQEALHHIQSTHLV